MLRADDPEEVPSLALPIEIASVAGATAQRKDIMHELNHWHPVLPSSELGRKPVPIRLCGTEIVLFRTADGQPGALEDRCAHRRMRLSRGRVEDRCLVCPYHGWGYEKDGRGRSPSA